MSKQSQQPTSVRHAWRFPPEQAGRVWVRRESVVGGLAADLVVGVKQRFAQQRSDVAAT